jgi:hypothetical protein
VSNDHLDAHFKELAGGSRKSKWGAAEGAFISLDLLLQHVHALTSHRQYYALASQQWEQHQKLHQKKHRKQQKQQPDALKLKDAKELEVSTALAMDGRTLQGKDEALKLFRILGRGLMLAGFAEASVDAFTRAIELAFPKPAFGMYVGIILL